MSEYSRTRLTKNDAQSRQGPTHPESGDGYDTPSRYSEQQTSPSNLQPPEDPFEIPMQHIMPLISTMKDENEHLKSERSLMQSDMALLQQLSQGLLQQNQKLRKHYNNRTVDIRRLIETITLNTNEQMNDLSHQTHLLKQSNISLVKTIEQQVAALHNASQDTTQQINDLQSLADQSQHLQQLQRDLQISNKQLFYKCEQLKNQNSRTDYSSSEEYINQLICEVTTIKNTNRNNILKAKHIRQQHQRERPEVEEKHANVTKHLRELEVEAKVMREQNRHTQDKLEDTKDNHEKHCTRLANTLKDYESAKYRLVQQDEQTAKIKRMAVEANTRVKKANQELLKVKKEKESLQAEILLKKTALKKTQTDQKKQLQAQQLAHKEQLKKYHNQLAAQSSRANEELMAKLNPESTLLQDSIDENRQEYAVLVQQLDELREGLKRLDNPVKEIIRLQYQLKKARTLKP